MIDKEFEIYNDLKTSILEDFPSVFVTADYINDNEKFPVVTIVQENNTINRDYADSSGEEKATNVMFEINVFSDKNRVETKEIMAFICDKMDEMGFTRIELNYLPDVERTIYRMVGRFTTVIDNNGIFYGR